VGGAGFIERDGFSSDVRKEEIGKGVCVEPIVRGAEHNCGYIREQEEGEEQGQTVTITEQIGSKVVALDTVQLPQTNLRVQIELKGANPTKKLISTEEQCIKLKKAKQTLKKDEQVNRVRSHKQ
jgi:hypothetical protein